MYMKLHSHGRDKLIAICDSELMGKTLEEKGVKICITSSFYGDGILDKGRVDELISECTIGNLMGEKSVSLGIEKGLINKESVITIAGVPHAQFVRMF